MDGVEEGLTRRTTYYTYCNTMKGRQLKRARSRLGMTQKQLGEELGVHWNSVARMEADYDHFPITRTTELAIKYLLLTKLKKRRGNRKK
jgi:DNA-binding XRE family transcriptional regulator